MADPIGFGRLRQRIDHILSGFDSAVSDGLNAAADHLISKAIPNAPVLTGELRKGFFKTAVRFTGNSASITVNNDVVYALRQHEELAPAGPNQLGRISEQEPGTEEGGVGGKFLERPAMYHNALHLRMIQERIDNLCRGD